MTRCNWRTVAGLGIAGMLVAAPSMQAGEETSGARGAGMSGTSTGARPREVSGEETPGGKPAGPATAHDGKTQVIGTIEQFDRVTRTLKLASSDKTLKLTDDTEVFKDGEKRSPGDVMEGDQVRASCSGSGDTLQVERLEVTGGTAGGSPSGAAPGGSERRP